MSRTNTAFWCSLLFGLLLTPLFSQYSRKVYFDRAGKACKTNVAYYYRLATDTPGYYRSHFMASGRPYFSGAIKKTSNTDEGNNVYEGACRWYYKNGQLQTFRTFGATGVEIGLSRYFYESGKLWKEIEFEKGKMKNQSYVEYSENGDKNRFFVEDFENNDSEWDLYSSDKGYAVISDGQLELASTCKNATSRYINHVIESLAYTIEASVSAYKLRQNDKVGIIFGFKDWENYHYFMISKKSVTIGSFYEGVRKRDVIDMRCLAINPVQENLLKITSNGEEDYFLVNGEVQFRAPKMRLNGDNIGFMVSASSRMKAGSLIIKELKVEPQVDATTSSEDKETGIAGSGIIFSAKGFILTSYHAVGTADRVSVEIVENSIKQSYHAELVLSDKENDLAILKIRDRRFRGLLVDYAFKENGSIDLGAPVFTIGFRHAFLGDDAAAKLANGRVSSKTGYNGNINSFQTTLPIQTASSGAPVFDADGKLIGIFNANTNATEKGSYAIKLNCIKNLVELLDEHVETPASSILQSLSFDQKVKVLTNYVVLLKIK